MSPIIYKALYRVYRPQTFAEVVGQESITRTLKNAIKERRISHAYLFNGPRGTGKTSTAKIFAKAVNCKDPQDGEPCNRCESCQGIQNGTIMDVIEIDAASNRGVDEIRDIREKVMLRPSAIAYKVYIIDEVHMLTTEAFNALLKTLEEPPSHVIFILATTEPHKIPLTIISRCQRFDFRKISLNSIVSRLRWVCEERKIKVTDETLALIARLSDGGMRDALSLLDQAYSFAGEAISAEDIHMIAGTLSQGLINQILRALKENRLAQALTLMDEALMTGKDPEQMIRGFVQYLRDILIFKHAPDLEEMQGRKAFEPEFPEICSWFVDQELYLAIEQLNKVQNEMKWTAHPRILLEIALVQLCTDVFHNNQIKIGQEAVQESDLLQRIAALEERIRKLESQDRAPRHLPVPEEPPSRAQTEKKLPNGGNAGFPLTKFRSLIQQANEKYLARFQELWPEILERIGQRDIRTKAFVKEGNPVIVTEDTILLAFNNEFHRNRTESPENKQIITEVIREKTNRNFHIMTVMKDEWLRYIKSQEEQQADDEDELIRQAITLVGEELVKVKKSPSGGI